MTIQKKRSPLFRAFLWVLRVFGILVLCFALLLAYLTAAEYKPQSEEKLEVKSGETTKMLKVNDNVSLLTWNIGYGALGDNADFFMDGGKSVQTADTQRVQENLQGIASEIDAKSPDVVFLQEVDTNSSRSHDINEADTIQNQLVNDGMSLANSTFAYNYKVPFIPYPIPPIGKVNSGILTLSNYNIADATRYQLLCPFSWPMRLGNLKRCLMVDLIPVMKEDGTASGKNLVLVNLHLEAYDDGEGKKAQTEMLRNILQKEMDAGNYVIAGGDFNQTFSGTDDSEYPELAGMWHCGEVDESEFSFDWQFEMDNKVPTCRSLDKAYAGADQTSFQYYMIDGFIVSKNITVSSVETQNLKFAHTDHNPVYMKIMLNQ